MTLVTYANTHTRIPGWVNTIHLDQGRGYAYESNGRFFHIYGRAHGLWTISTGLTTSEPKGEQVLNSWIQKVFGASHQEKMSGVPGRVISGVWRPGLFLKKEVHQALNIDEYAQRSAEQALRVLIEKLDDILLYIEPSPLGLQAYGHRCRELLILACTEVENFWGSYMRLANVSAAGRVYTTNDYVRLMAPLHLQEYSIDCQLAGNTFSIRPFSQWSAKNPTQSLPWYGAYNKTKHDREQYFSEATLENCMHAIAAVIVMFCVRYSPFSLVEAGSALAGLFIQHFNISLKNPDSKSFYVPEFDIPSDLRTDLFCASMTDHVKPWQAVPLLV